MSLLKREEGKDSCITKSSDYKSLFEPSKELESWGILIIQSELLDVATTSYLNSREIQSSIREDQGSQIHLPTQDLDIKTAQQSDFVQRAPFASIRIPGLGLFEGNF